MEAQELMVGDYVKLKSGKVVEITQVDGTYGTISYFDGDAGGELSPSIKVIEPIPLTPEILEKNGFENDFYEEESVADYHTIRLEGYSLKSNIGEINGYLVTWCNGGVNVTTDFCGCIQKDISFVHELQHALKLCGIEKEIVL